MKLYQLPGTLNSQALSTLRHFHSQALSLPGTFTPRHFHSQALNSQALHSVIFTPRHSQLPGTLNSKALSTSRPRHSHSQALSLPTAPNKLYSTLVLLIAVCYPVLWTLSCRLYLVISVLGTVLRVVVCTSLYRYLVQSRDFSVCK